MLKEPTLVNYCKHERVVKNDVAVTYFLTKSSEDYSTIDDDRVIKRILSVDSPFEYVFNRQNKRIVWVGLDKPNEGDVIEVTAIVVNEEKLKYETHACPMCAGRGWFIALLPNTSPCTGSDKLIQDFIKVLLSDNRIYSLSYGTSLISLIGKSEVEAEIKEAITSAERQIIKNQDELRGNNQVVPPSEKLAEVELLDFESLNNDTEIFLSMRLISEDDEETEIRLGV